MAFVGVADVMGDGASEHAGYVILRLQAMLAPHGMSIGVMETTEE